MKCENCGNILVGNEKFCNGCGSPVHTISNVNNMVQPPQVNNDSSVNSASNIIFTPGNNNSSVDSAPSVNVIPPKKNNTKTVILVLLLVLIVGSGCAFGGYFLANNNNDSSNEKEDKDDKEEVKQTSSSVYYAGVRFVIPSNYSYTQDSKGLYITNSKWLALLQENSLPFSSVLLVKDTLKTNLEQQGMVITSMEEKTLSSNKYLVFNANSGGINCFILMTEVKSGSSLLIMLTDPNGGNVNEDWIKELDKIISNVETSNKDNSMILDDSILENFKASLINDNNPTIDDDVVVEDVIQ